MAETLCDLLPRDENLSSDNLLGRFLDYLEGRRLTLYPAQEKAALELFEDKNVTLNTPTGSGKSLVAMALHFASLARGRRSVCTCPIKALVNEKWLAPWDNCSCAELNPITLLSHGASPVPPVRAGQRGPLHRHGAEMTVARPLNRQRASRPALSPHLRGAVWREDGSGWGKVPRRFTSPLW